MTRISKALGVLLLTMLVSTATAAIARGEVSSPAEFTTDPGPFFDAEQVGTNTLTVVGLPAFTCGSLTAAGQGVTEGPNPEKITLSPTYGTCHVVLLGLTKPITITTNGCAFVLTATTTEIKGVKTFTAHTDIECPTEKQIEIHVYNNAGHTELLCTYDIKAQTNLTEITLTNNEAAIPNDLDADFNVSGIAVQNTKTGGVCGTQANTTATYKGTQTIRATAGYFSAEVTG